MAATPDTISISSAHEMYSESFFTGPITFIPNRDLRFSRDLLFKHMTTQYILNPMTNTTNVEIPSIRDLVINLMRSKHAWVDAIHSQKTIIRNSKIYITEQTRVLESQFRRAVYHDEHYSPSHRHRRFNIEHIARRLTWHSRFLEEFTYHNKHLLITRETDDDEPFNIFNVKLPIWCIGDRDENVVNWSSLTNVLRSHLKDNINPSPPNDEFCPFRYIRRIFNHNVISNRTPTQYDSGSRFEFRAVMDTIRSKIYGTPNHTTGQYGFFVRDGRSVQHAGIGKVRYTLAVILRWIELTHYHLFRDQISHSILHYFYSNIHTEPVRIRTIHTRITSHSHIHAHIRTLTSENMPDESDDPVLLTPFEQGMIVYKMECCKKDISKTTIIGIIQSGRTAKCPMCRSSLYTTNTEFPPNPTLENSTEECDIEYIPDEPSYMRNPHISPTLYSTDPFHI